MKRNKIIEELVAESTTTSNSYDDRFGNTISAFFDKDKFAKLIIKECIIAASSNPYASAETLIKERFGIK